MAALVVTVAAAARINHLRQNRVEEKGGVFVVIEGRDLRFWGGQDSAGVGVGGTLGLVADRCVALGGQVVVWPPGTTVSGSGKDIRISSRGRTVGLGDQVEGGGGGSIFPWVRSKLPEECRDAELVGFDFDA